jgi:ClpP class serine protease
MGGATDPPLPDEGVPPTPAAVRVSVPDIEVDERDARKELIRRLEHERGRPLIVYITDPRGGTLGTGIGEDVPALLYEHLELLGHQEGIDLLLATGGGHTMAANNIVHLIREYCDDFAVLVPHRAMSAGTLIALGANHVVMGPLGRLGVCAGNQDSVNEPPPGVQFGNHSAV